MQAAGAALVVRSAIAPLGLSVGADPVWVTVLLSGQWVSGQWGLGQGSLGQRIVRQAARGIERH